ncbi:MAG: hypothetical protein KF866_06865 [Phycisphaeraceae bacterium]|nr:hypothetical protein [Phycisphaeraceae bacterium]MCW5755425.1 hypothetical protein [Phycisphaeraceae bacterium]
MPADRDLLVLEPTLFRDVLWLGQRLLVGEASLTGALLTLTTAGLTFSGVSPGCVIVVQTTYCEIVSIESPTEAVISLVRSDATDPPHPPASGTGLAVGVTTFGPQLGLAKKQVLGLFGLSDMSGVTNPGDLDELIAVGALLLIHGAAAALSPPGSPGEARLGYYRSRYGMLRARAEVHLDLDGDGKPEATRRAGAGVLVRA